MFSLFDINLYIYYRVVLFKEAKYASWLFQSTLSLDTSDLTPFLFVSGLCCTSLGALSTRYDNYDRG